MFDTLLKTHRNLKGLSLEALAKQIGVSYQTVQHWERGRHYPKPDKLPALSALLDLSPALIQQAIYKDQYGAFSEHFIGCLDYTDLDIMRAQTECEALTEYSLKVSNIYDTAERLSRLADSQDIKPVILDIWRELGEVNCTFMFWRLLLIPSSVYWIETEAILEQHPTAEEKYCAGLMESCFPCRNLYYLCLILSGQTENQFFDALEAGCRIHKHLEAQHLWLKACAEEIPSSIKFLFRRIIDNVTLRQLMLNSKGQPLQSAPLKTLYFCDPDVDFACRALNALVSTK